MKTMYIKFIRLVYSGGKNETIYCYTYGNANGACIFAPAANAIEKNEVWNGEIADSFESGDGTFESPYIIAKPSQLALLAQLVNNGIGDFATLYYAVTNQLVLNGDTISNQWMPLELPSNHSGIL